MERQTIKLNYELKVQLIKIIHAGRITPEEADILIPLIDARGKAFNIRDIYSDVTSEELIQRAEALHKIEP